jgi:hypothetical protein
MKTDRHNDSRAMRCLGPQALTTTAGATGKIVDRKGFNGVEFVIGYGAVTATNATITPTVYEGDATGAMTSVANADLLGTEALAALPAQASARTSGVGKFVATRIGYVGRKRYVNVKLVPTVTAATVVSVLAVLHTPSVAPTSNP